MGVIVLLPRYAPLLLGASLAAVVSGKVTFGIFLILGIILTFFSSSFSNLIHIGWQKLRTPLGVSIFSLMLAWALSLFFSILPWVSGQVYLRMIAFVFLSLWLHKFFLEDESRRILFLRSLLVSLFVVLTLALIGGSFVPDLLGAIKAKHIESISAARLELKSFGSLAGLLIPFVLWAGFLLGAAWRYAGFFVAILLLLVIVMSQSQSAMAGMMAMGLVFLICGLFSRWKHKRGAIVLSLCLILFFCFLAMFESFSQGQNLFEVLQENQYENLDLYLPPWLVDPHRQIIWRHVAELGLQKYWFGWGINTINFADQLEQINPSIVEGLTPYAAHPHNWLLEVLSETGFVGIVPMLVFISMLFWFPFNSFLKTQNIIFVVMLAVSAGFWVSGLFGFSFWSAWWQVSYILLLVVLGSALRGEGGAMGALRLSSEGSR